MISDETLMAYADGELGEPERSIVEAAARDDPAVAASIARHRALRADVYGAFAGVLDEPVPARLQPAGTHAATGAASATETRIGSIVSLAAARERKAKARAAANAAGQGAASGLPRRAWPRWGALAASLAVGVLAGSLWMTGGGDAGLVATDMTGRLVAKGELAGALSQQLASDAQPGKRVRIGVTFAARGGGYCRSFSTGSSAGLACRDGEIWRIPVLQDAAAENGAYRQAGNTAPAAVLEVIDERMEGMTLDAAGERAARDRGWKR